MDVHAYGKFGKIYPFFALNILCKNGCAEHLLSSIGIKLKHRMSDIQRKQTEKKLINRTEFCRTNSYIGWLLKCNSWRLFEKYIEPILPSLILYHRRIIHKITTPEVRKASCRRYQRHLYKMRQQIAKEV